jgi:hypothetical protein
MEPRLFFLQIDMSEILLLIQLVSTLTMVGVIWFVQVVHYPLMARVGPDAFHRYQDGHQKLTTLVVGAPMVAELFATVLLTLQLPERISPAMAWVGVAMLAVVWGSTILLQIPLHHLLEGGFDRDAIHQLVATNWIRTIAWTARGALVVAMALQLWRIV